MEVSLSRQRMKSRFTQSIQRHVDETLVQPLDMRTAKSGGAEVAREELEQAKMRRNQICCETLSPGDKITV